MQHISAGELKQKINNGEDIFLIDVREPSEHNAYNIGGILIPLNEILLQSSSVPKNTTVVVYCSKGIRSQIAIQRLEDKFSFSNLINLQGGTEAWLKEI